MLIRAACVFCLGFLLSASAGSVKAETIYNYLLGKEEVETLIMCKPDGLDLVTTDQSLYEALGSVEDKSSLDYGKLVKFLESVDILSFKHSVKKPRTILKDERVGKIRQLAKNEGSLNIRSNHNENNRRGDNHAREKNQS